MLASAENPNIRGGRRVMPLAGHYKYNEWIEMNRSVDLPTYLPFDLFVSFILFVLFNSFKIT